MIKINPTTLKYLPNVKNIKSKFPNLLTPNKLTIATSALAVASVPVMFSGDVKEYNKSIGENNYFQLKINSNTGKPYEADIFQKTAANYLYNGDDVVVTAPTGTGKTAIAEYIMTKNLKEGKKTFYTTPLKALSNEKYKDFCNVYGEENVGLLTGDTKINSNAPIIIMTTEVFRNMTLSEMFNKQSNLPANLKTVIFDELQYLGDVDRGGVWEQSIMFAPKNVQMLSLSATAKNAEQINKWIAEIKNITPEKAECDGIYKPRKQRKAVWVDVPAENRHVPLDITIESANPDMKVSKTKNKYKQKEAQKKSEKKAKTIYAKPNDESYVALTSKLKAQDKLPAIYFVFSKKESRNLLQILSNNKTLTTHEEQKEIEEIIQRYKNEGKYLGEKLNVEALLNGFAIHNSGLLPTQKELVEELFQKKLVKVAIATETLSAGINMPARTTVISSPRKPASTSDGGEDGKRNLTANEFHQMAGRAGRRGIDTQGFCLPLSCNKAQNKLFEELKASPSNNLVSNFKFDTSFVANYLANYSGDTEIKEIIRRTLYGRGNKYLQSVLLKQFETLKEVLKRYKFIEKDKLTLKGELLRKINGYEQIPVINLIAKKQLAGLKSTELASVASALANIQYNDTSRLPLKPFVIDSRSRNVDKITENLANDLKLYRYDMRDEFENTELGLNANAITHLYEWARLNELNENSKECWKDLCNGELKDTISDEGSLFKEITMTIDLMKQMSEICEVGIELSDDKEYYIKLQENLQEAIYLIQREPADTEHL